MTEQHEQGCDVGEDEACVGAVTWSVAPCGMATCVTSCGNGCTHARELRGWAGRGRGRGQGTGYGGGWGRMGKGITL